MTPEDEAARETGFPVHVHLLGAGGAGVSGMARILAARGHVLTGHDRGESELLQALRRDEGFPLEVGESRAECLPRTAELVVRSAAVGADDPQVQEARRRGVRVMKYAEALGALPERGRLLAVAGTHGKTTTAWMMLHALVGLRMRTPAHPAPGALIGGLCRTLGTNALAGRPGGWFVAEACEYDRSFLHLAPRGAVITNVEADHLDYYGSLEAIHLAFARFADLVHEDGLLVLGPDVPESIENAARCEVWRLGREIDARLLGEERGRFRFELRGPGWVSPEVELAVPGHFNVQNAALALALAAGLATGESFPRDPDLELAAGALSRFEGAARRFEGWGEVDGVQLVHDYAHHPTEVRVTLEAARRVFAGRPIHVLFQPHQHSRTARFHAEFVECLRGADRVVVADVYGARAHIDGAHTADERLAGARELVNALRAAHVDAEEGGALASAAERFVAGLPSGPKPGSQRAAALVLGAGDVENLKDDLLRRLALRGTSGSRASS